jgi:hypothetical protein
MIINFLKREGKKYKTFFVNLTTAECYSFDDEEAEVRVKHPISRLELEQIIIREIGQTQDQLDEAASTYPPTDRSIIEVTRLNNKIQYLLDYEHSNPR